MEKELNFLGTALENPERPFVAILGGAKVSDKIAVIDSLMAKVDSLIIGGAMANTFVKAMGYNVGKSLCEDDKIDLANELMEKAKAKGVKLILPVDAKLGKEFSKDTESKTVDIENVFSNITMNDIKLNKLDIENVSGEVKMKNITAIDISLETVSGGADTENIIAKNLNCDTVSGNLKMRGSFTDVDAESVSGDIEVYSKEKVNSADVETVSGDFEITIPENSGFTVDMDSTKKLSSAFETTNRGDLIISGDGSAEFDFETVSGQFSIKK